MPKNPALILIAAHLALSGCGDGVKRHPGHEPGDVEQDTPDAATDADDPDASLEVPPCDYEEGLVLTGAFDETSLAPDPELYQGKIIGFSGALGSGDEFLFRRDGDYSDGDIQDIGTYDVSTYPHNFVFMSGPEISECESADNCGGFYALDGFFTVTQLTPRYEATFRFTSLHEGGGEDPGAPMAGEVTGCLSVPL
jgi:hypothetical protein